MPSRRMWFGATAVASYLALSGLPASAQTPPTVPSVTVPSVTVPPITVETPVPTPPVTTPPVKTPTVTTPSVSVPVPTKPPAVKTPLAPTATTPSVGGGSAPSAGSPSSDGTGTGASAASGSATAGGPSQGAQPSASNAEGAPASATVHETYRRERALRRAVLRFQSCLGSVPRAERRVLSLRAGLGVAHTRTRGEVARLTGLRPSRVARLEQRGLQRLRDLGRSGRCGAASNTAGGDEKLAATVPGGSPGALGDAESGADATVQRASSRTPEARAVQVHRPLIDLGAAPRDLAPFLIAFAIGAMLVLVLRQTRRA